jgi:hypothetical protein
MTTADAQGVASGLSERGRKQTNDVLKDLEQLLERGRGEVEGRTSGVRKAAGGAVGAARGQARERAAVRCARRRDRSPRADRARRAAGVGAELPDHRVRRPHRGPGGEPAEHPHRRPSSGRCATYERRNANRKTVLNSIESKLG